MLTASTSTGRRVHDCGTARGAAPSGEQGTREREEGRGGLLMARSRVRGSGLGGGRGSPLWRRTGTSSMLEEAGWRGGPASSGFGRGAVPAGRRMKWRRRWPASEGEEVGSVLAWGGGELRAPATAGSGRRFPGPGRGGARGARGVERVGDRGAVRVAGGEVWSAGWAGLAGRWLALWGCGLLGRSPVGGGCLFCFFCLFVSSVAFSFLFIYFLFCFTLF